MDGRARGALIALLAFALLFSAACTGDDDAGSSEAEVFGLPGEWPTFARNLERTGYNPDETKLTRDTVDDLVVKWRFPTEMTVAASPAVATVDVPGEGPTRIVVVGSYDGNVYAVRASDGSELWRHKVKPHPGVSYGSIASSATIAEVDGRPRVFVGGGMTLYAIDAVTGERVWEFDAGTGCTTCDTETERNEILSSPAVLPEQDLVLFGMDINDSPPGKGGFYAVSATDGRLRWYFDTDTLATCRPQENDDVRKFDGYHSAEALGLPEEFFTSRDGCDFDRTETACGGVWSPVTVDRARERIYFVTTNCDTDDDPSTVEPEPPMPGINEGLAVLDYDGSVAWTWRPREVDNDDLAFGAAPNLFTVVINGVERDVVGVGGKDGTYYLLDRDGENVLTGEVEPYWERNVVPGGAIGGMLGTPAVGDGRVYFGTGIGEEIVNFQKPAAWALDAAGGEVVWSQEDAAPTYSPTAAVPGVVFIGGVDASLHAYDAETGELIKAFPLGGLVVSQAVIVDGELFIGSGFGAKGVGDDIAAELARRPASIWAFCIQGQEGCEGEPIENFQ